MMPAKKSANPNSVELDNLLAAISSTMQDIGLLAWFECGTLLGAVRDNDYIPWEDDLDFGANILDVTDNTFRDLKAGLEDRGFHVQKYKSYIHISVINSDVHADINLYDTSDPVDATVDLQGPGASSISRLFYMLISLAHGKEIKMRVTSTKLNRAIYIFLRNIFAVMPGRVRASLQAPLAAIYGRYLLQDVSWHVPKEYLLSFDEVIFRGISVHLPRRSEEYLAHRYGRDWNVPRQAYDTWKDDKTIIRVE